MKLKFLTHVICYGLLSLCYFCRSEPMDKVINELPVTFDHVSNFQILDVQLVLDDRDKSAPHPFFNSQLDPYPFYEFYSKKLDAYITICFLGKTQEERKYWSINNLQSFFSHYKNVNEPHLLSDEIKKHLLARELDNYEITARLLYKKDIRRIYSDDDIKLKPNAHFYLYSFKNHKWIFVRLE